MAQLVCMTAMLKCTSGDAPTALVVAGLTVLGETQPAANIMDNKPIANIVPFGTCKVLTSAASGVPTPCVPAIVTPWAPGSPTVPVRGLPALNNTSTCTCTVGGVISITSAGCTKEMVP